MPKYIDAEKLKRDLIDNRSFYPAIVKNAIENAPTEDVVPRSEYEKMKEKADRHLDNLKAVLDERAEEKSKVERYMLKSDGSLEMIPTVESVRQDVAREIFEEIEKSIMSPDQSQNYKEWYFAELKKKYIGE